jgi:hypothetical protein
MSGRERPGFGPGVLLNDGVFCSLAGTGYNIGGVGLRRR